MIGRHQVSGLAGLALLAASNSTLVDSPERVYSKHYTQQDKDRALLRAENRKKAKAARQARKRNRK